MSNQITVMMHLWVNGERMKMWRKTSVTLETKGPDPTQTMTEGKRDLPTWSHIFCQGLEPVASFVLPES